MERLSGEHGLLSGGILYAWAVMALVFDAFGHVAEVLPWILVRLAGLGLAAGMAYLPGRALAGPVRFAGRLEAFTVSVLLGFLLVATAAFGLGLFGILRPLPLGVATGTVVAAGGMVLWRRRASHFPGVRSGRVHPLPMIGAFAVLVLLTALTLYPPTLFDATHYHLPYATVFAESGSLPFIEELRFPIFPQLQEVLFSLGILVAGETAPRALELLLTVLSVLAVYSLAAGRRGRWAGGAAAALWLGCPAVVYYGTAAFVDVGTAAFVVAAAVCLDRHRSKTEGSQPDRWLVLAGMLLGGAAASKYLALAFIPLFAVEVALRTHRVRPVAWLVVGATIVAAPWYVRIAWWTGNPVFPLLPEIFGASEWAVGPAPLPSWNEVFRLPVTLTLDRGQAWGPPPFNGWLLALSPLLLVPGALRRSRLGGVLAVASAYFVPWLLWAREPRFLLPAVALVCGVMGVALGQAIPRMTWKSLRLSSLWVPVGLLLLVSPGLAYGAYRVAHLGSVPTTPKAREAFLNDHVRGYRALSWLHDHHRGNDFTVYTVGGQHLHHFVRGRRVGDAFGPFRYRSVMTPGGQISAHRLREVGAEYLLVMGSAPHGRSSGFELLYQDAQARLYDIPQASTGNSPGSSWPRLPDGPPGARWCGTPGSR